MSKISSVSIEVIIRSPSLSLSMGCFMFIDLCMLNHPWHEASVIIVSNNLGVLINSAYKYFSMFFKEFGLNFSLPVSLSGVGIRVIVH